MSDDASGSLHIASNQKMKRASNTRLRIRQSAVQVEEAPTMGFADTGTIEDFQVPIEKEFKVQDIARPKEIVSETIVVDSTNLDVLKNATEEQLSVVSRLIVRNAIPIMDEVLKKKFLQDVSILFRKDGDKDSNEIRKIFDNFWKYTVKLPMFGEGTTLEIENCFLVPYVHMYETKFDTLIMKYTDTMAKQVKLPAMNLNPHPESSLERLVVGKNVKLDCTGLTIETLVCINILSCVDTISLANEIRKLIILTEMNVIPDADPERGDMCFEFPLPRGVHTIYVPEAQEFKYNHYAIHRSNLKFVGIIPSAYYPSRMAVGIQKTWQPIHRESLEQDFVNLIRQGD